MIELPDEEQSIVFSLPSSGGNRYFLVDPLTNDVFRLRAKGTKPTPIGNHPAYREANKVGKALAHVWREEAVPLPPPPPNVTSLEDFRKRRGSDTPA